MFTKANYPEKLPGMLESLKGCTINSDDFSIEENDDCVRFMQDGQEVMLFDRKDDKNLWPTYQYFTDSKCKRLGAHAWTSAAVVCTEFLICLKFGRGQFPNPWPSAVVVSWMVAVIALVLFPVYKFWYLSNREKCE